MLNQNKKEDWRLDKDSKKYKKYLEKRKKAMEEKHRQRLEKLNRTPPSNI